MGHHKKNKLKELILGIALAQKPIGNIGGEPGTGLGPFSNLFQFRLPVEAAKKFTQVISNILGVMTIVAGLWFLFRLIIGAYAYMSAGGEAQKIQDATKQITNALIGLIIVVLAYAFLSLIGRLLGLDILNPQAIIPNLGPR